MPGRKGLVKIAPRARVAHPGSGEPPGDGAATWKQDTQRPSGESRSAVRGWAENLSVEVGVEEGSDAAAMCRGQATRERRWTRFAKDNNGERRRSSSGRSTRRRIVRLRERVWHRLLWKRGLPSWRSGTEGAGVVAAGMAGPDAGRWGRRLRWCCRGRGTRVFCGRSCMGFSRGGM